MERVGILNSETEFFFFKVAAISPSFPLGRELGSFVSSPG